MIVGLYGALLALLLLLLSARTILVRRSLKIGIGDGESKEMLRAIRVHSNFCEYVPLALTLALIIELSKGNSILVHLVCMALLLGRCIHAWGVSKKEENFKFRVTGMILTFSSILTSALTLIALSVLKN